MGLKLAYTILSMSFLLLYKILVQHVNTQGSYIFEATAFADDYILAIILMTFSK